MNRSGFPLKATGIHLKSGETWIGSVPRSAESGSALNLRRRTSRSQNVRERRVAQTPYGNNSLYISCAGDITHYSRYILTRLSFAF